MLQRDQSLNRHCLCSENLNKVPSFGPVEAGGKLTEGTGPAEGVGVSMQTLLESGTRGSILLT